MSFAVFVQYLVMSDYIIEDFKISYMFIMHITMTVRSHVQKRIILFISYILIFMLIVYWNIFIS